MLEAYLAPTFVLRRLENFDINIKKKKKKTHSGINNRKTVGHY